MRDGNLGVTQAPPSRLQRHLDRPAIVVREIGERERHLDLAPAGTESSGRAALSQADEVLRWSPRRRAVSHYYGRFQTGHEMNWLSQAMHVLRDELKNIQATISSGRSPDLAEARDQQACGPRRIIAHRPAERSRARPIVASTYRPSRRSIAGRTV